MRFAVSYMLYLLDVVILAINNVRKYVELQTRLSEFGFDDAKLTEGVERHKKAKDLFYAKESNYGTQYLKTERVMKMYNDILKYYRKYTSMVRLVLKRDTAALLALRLRKDRPRTMMGILEKIRHFFQKLLDDAELFNRVAGIGITPEILQEGLNKIDAFHQEDEVQEALKGQSQDTTSERDKAFLELHDYWQLFKKAFENATEDRPQLREMVKIKAYSPEYARQKRKKAKDDQTQTDETQSNETQSDQTQVENPAVNQ